MKTIKQIADEMGLPKQKVYRYIKANNIVEAHRDSVTSYYDGDVEEQIKAHFSNRMLLNEVLRSAPGTPSAPGEAVQSTQDEVRHIAPNEAHQQVAKETHRNTSTASHQCTSCDALVGMLQTELEIKNKQIEDLSKMLTAAQHAANQAQLFVMADGSKPGVFSRLFKGQSKSDGWERVE